MKKQKIAVIGPNAIQSMDGSNPFPTLAAPLPATPLALPMSLLHN